MEILKKRIAFLDVLKAFAIFLVVWGHSLQNLTADRSYWEYDACVQVIYSFHMPLFMMISGFFSVSLLKRELWDVIKKQFVRLIVPSITWHIGVSILLFVVGTIATSNIDWDKLYSIALASLSVFWFLKALFLVQIFSSLLVYSFRVYKSILTILGGISILLLIYFLPVAINFVCWFSMVPFYLLGLMVRQYAEKYEEYEQLLMWIFLSIFLVLVCIWPHATFDIYSNPIGWSWGALLAFLKRTLVGSAGSLFCYFALKRLFARSKRHCPRIEAVGTMTLGIYIIQRYIVERAAVHLGGQMDVLLSSIPFVFRTILYDLFIAPAFSLVVVTISYWLILRIRTNKKLKTLLLGEV